MESYDVPDIDFELSDKSIGVMLAAEVVEEYRQIQAALDKPHIAPWFGFNQSFESKIQARLTQLRTRLANEYVKTKLKEQKNEY